MEGTKNFSPGINFFDQKRTISKTVLQTRPAMQEIHEAVKKTRNFFPNNVLLGPSPYGNSDRINKSR